MKFWWAELPLQLLVSPHLFVFLPFVLVSSLCLGFGLTFLLVIPGTVMFLVLQVRLESIFFLLCLGQGLCSTLFFFSLLRLRQKYRERNISESVL